MTFCRGYRESWKWLRVATVAFLCFIAPRLFGSSCMRANDNRTPIRPDTEIRAQLSGTSHHSYSLYLPGSSLIRIVLEQDAPKLMLCVFSAAGEQLEWTQPRFRGDSAASFAASAPGDYDIVVANTSADVSDLTSYRLLVEKLKLSPSAYKASLAAERAFRLGHELRAEIPATALYSAISKYRVAGQQWAAAGDLNGEVRALTSAAEALLELSEYSRALQTFAVLEHLAHGSDRLLVRAVNGRSRVYLDQWDSVAALQSANQAILLSRSVGDRLAEADALTSRGEAYYLQTDDNAATADLQDALSIAKAEGDRLTLARALRALAWVNEDEGKLYEAKQLMQQAEQFFRQIGDARASTNAIGDIATIESIRGDTFSALSSHLEALRLLRKMGQRSGHAFMLEALGTDYLQLNETNTASGYFSQALEEFTRLRHLSGRQEALLQLCGSELSMGRISLARMHCSESVDLVGKLHDPKREAIALRSLGAVEDSTGRTGQAVALYVRGAELSHSVHDPRFEAAALISIGQVREREGDHQAAILLYERASALSLQGEAPDNELRAHYEMARSQKNLGQIAKAQSELDQALLLAAKKRAAVRSELLRTSYFASVRKCYDLYVETLMDQHSSFPSAGFDLAALEKTETGRARTLLEALNEFRSEPAPEMDKGAAAQLRRTRVALTAAYDQRLKLMLNDGNPESLTENARAISLLTTEYDRKLENLYEMFHSHESTAPLPTVKQVLSTFAEPGTVILEYLLGEERSFAWRIAEGKLKTYSMPGKEAITRDVQRWRNLLVSRKPKVGESLATYNLRVRASDQSLQKQGQRLACEILSPLEGVKAERLVVIADGPLNSVPFAALPLNACSQKGGAPLITAYQVVSLPSLLLLPALRKQEQQHRDVDGEVAILADPVFSRDDPRVHSQPTGSSPSPLGASPLGLALRDVGWSRALPRLPATRREGKAIAAKARHYNTFIGLDFDANLKNALSPKLSHFRILHFATHGLLDTKHPELSGLVFSLVDKEGRDIDGYLQTQEVSELNLQADLVVLSACNSGLGKEVSGEGTMGLTRAFLHAGVPHVLSTLWSIEDEATRELMGHFYDAILEKRESPAIALREAQLHVLKDQRWSHPFYWGGFTLTGDWH